VEGSAALLSNYGLLEGLLGVFMLLLQVEVRLHLVAFGLPLEREFGEVLAGLLGGARYQFALEHAPLVLGQLHHLFVLALPVVDLLEVFPLHQAALIFAVSTGISQALFQSGLRFRIPGWHGRSEARFELRVDSREGCLRLEELLELLIGEHIRVRYLHGNSPFEALALSMQEIFQPLLALRRAH